MDSSEGWKLAGKVKEGIIFLGKEERKVMILKLKDFGGKFVFFFNGNPTNLLENQTETTKEQVQIDITEKRRTTNKSNKCQNKQTREKRRHHQG